MINVYFNLKDPNIKVDILNRKGDYFTLDSTDNCAHLIPDKYQVEFTLGGERIYEYFDCSYGEIGDITYSTKRAESHFDGKFGEIRKAESELKKISNNLIFFLENQSRNRQLAGSIELLNVELELVAVIKISKDEMTKIVSLCLEESTYYLREKDSNQIQPLLLSEGCQRIVHIIFDQGLHLLNQQYQFESEVFDISKYYSNRKMTVEYHTLETMELNSLTGMNEYMDTKSLTAYLHKFFYNRLSLRKEDKQILKDFFKDLLPQYDNPDLKILISWLKYQWRISEIDITENYLENIVEFELSTSYKYLLDLSVLKPNIFSNPNFQFVFNTSSFFIKKKLYINSDAWKNIELGSDFKKKIRNFLSIILSLEIGYKNMERIDKSPRTELEYFISYSLSRPHQILLSIVNKLFYRSKRDNANEVSQLLLNYSSEKIAAFNDRFSNMWLKKNERKEYIFSELKNHSKFSLKEMKQIMNQFWFEFDKSFEPRELVRQFGFPAHVLNLIVDEVIEANKPTGTLPDKVAIEKLRSDNENMDANFELFSNNEELLLHEI